VDEFVEPLLEPEPRRREECLRPSPLSALSGVSGVSGVVSGVGRGAVFDLLSFVDSAVSGLFLHFFFIYLFIFMVN